MFLASVAVIPTAALAADRISPDHLNQRNKHAVLPTGAKSLAHFRSRCTACHLCVVKTKGTSCGACNEHCPTQAVHMVPWENGLTIPEVDSELCIGGGGCEFICPVRPDKAIVVDGLVVHEKAKIIQLGQENTVREMEEEFPF